MPAKQPYEILAEVYTPHLIKQVALDNGIENSTARCWSYDPAKSGKANPIDRVVRLVKLLHRYDPGACREIAAHVTEVVNELDQAAGIASCESGDGILACLRSAIKESSDVSVALVSDQMDLASLRRALTEIEEDRSAIEKLDSAVRQSIRQREVEELTHMTSQER